VSVSPDVAASFASHPANTFAAAFANVRRHSAMRAFYGPLWPLVEIFSYDMVRNMRVIHAFVDPLVNRAIERMQAQETEADKNAKSDHVQEGETLLDHLVKISKGEL